MTQSSLENPQESATRDKRRRRRRAYKWLRRGILVVVASLVVVAVVLAFLPKAVPVDFGTVRRGPLKVEVEEDGQTRVRNRYILSAPLAGNMNRITLLSGDQVDEGHSLGRVVPAAAPLLSEQARAEAEARLAAASAGEQQSQAEVGRAKAALEQITAEANRLERLLAAGAVTPAELETARFSLQARTQELQAAQFAAKVAARTVDSARAVLGILDRKKGSESEGLEIIAPVAGQVLRVLRPDAHGLVQPGTPLIEVGDLASLEIVADVLTADAVKIREGARVEIVRWGGEGTLVGHVRRIEPSAFTRVSALGVEEQRVNVIIDLDSNRGEWRLLGDGYRVEVLIEVWQEDDVLIAPASAVFRRGEGFAGYAVKDGVARLVEVEVGRRTDTEVQVTAGLVEGDQVVLHPGDRLADGVKVEARAP